MRLKDLFYPSDKAESVIENTEPIGGDAMPDRMFVPVDDIEVIRLEYRGEWYEVEKTPGGLEIHRCEGGETDV